MQNGLLNKLLLPKSIYQKLTDKKSTLYAGIFFVGAYDIGVTLAAKYFGVFSGKSAASVNYNIGLALLFAVIIGIIDIMCFSLPLFDLFKFIKKGAVGNYSSALVKFTKVYILAHIIILPLNVLTFMIIYNPAKLIISDNLIVIALLIDFFIIPAWFAGIIARGTNVVFSMEEKLKPLVFACVFTWNYILGVYALDYVIKNWVMYFFR